MTLKEVEGQELEDILTVNDECPTVKKDGSHYYFFEYDGRFRALVPIPNVDRIVEKMRKNREKLSF